MIDLLAMTITCIFLLVVTKRKLITRFIIIASLHIISSKTKPSGRIGSNRIESNRIESKESCQAEVIKYISALMIVDSSIKLAFKIFNLLTAVLIF